MLLFQNHRQGFLFSYFYNFQTKELNFQTRISLLEISTKLGQGGEPSDAITIMMMDHATYLTATMYAMGRLILMAAETVLVEIQILKNAQWTAQVHL